MDRVSSPGYQTLTVGRSWQNMNLGSAIQGTTFDQVWFQGVQESIVETIAKSGQTPTDSTLGLADTQLLNAILAFAGANVQAITSTPGSALPAIDAGLVLVNATAGNISITMPASAALGAQMQHWRFVRTDATSNTVSIAFHAGDTILIGGGSGPVSLAGPSILDMLGDGISHWVLSSPTPFMQPVTTSGTFTVPAFLTSIEVEVWGAGSGGVGGTGAAGSAGGYAWGVYPVTPGSAVTVTIGAGGAGATGASGNPSVAGGTTSFGALLSATGGSAVAGSAVGVPVPGGMGSGGQVNLPGGMGGDLFSSGPTSAVGGAAPRGAPGGFIQSSQAAGYGAGGGAAAAGGAFSDYGGTGGNGLVIVRG